MNWLLLQLADGTFPSGGFAHSGGLEAMSVLGGASRDPAAFLDASLTQTASAALPFVRAAAQDPTRLAQLDADYDATLPFLAPNRASRAQGRALASAASRVWPDFRPGPYTHHAPTFGALFGSLGQSSGDAGAIYLHHTARTILSAAVRLGLLGPLAAQQLLAERAALLERLDSQDASLDDVAQTAPLLEMYAALHERLDGRMFQS